MPVVLAVMPVVFAVMPVVFAVTPVVFAVTPVVLAVTREWREAGYHAVSQHAVLGSACFCLSVIEWNSEVFRLFAKHRGSFCCCLG